MRSLSSNVQWLVFAFLCSASAPAQTERDREHRKELPLSEGLRLQTLDAPVRVTSDVAATKLHRSLVSAEGRQQVIVRLKTPSVARARVERSVTARQHREQIFDEQDDFVDRCYARARDVRVLARVQLVLNAVFLEVDASALPYIAADPAVMRVAPVANYEMDLSETVPHIGAAAVQATGVDGTGVRVAILDSGIDYTHANLGGPGTLAAYAEAYGSDPADPLNTTRDGLFPTAKVIEGFDFVGETWPAGPLAPDPDPIDFDGHGTHVADIAGGLGGVAPGASLYAVKVCSAVSTSCSGIALIQGMEFAVDPNGDGDPEDRVDIVNMSLGANYGQPFDDDLSAAVDNATGLGVFTVAAAGNAEDKPYIVATPSAANTALSVAQTHVPSAFQQLMELSAPPGAEGFYEVVFQPWSAPLTSVVSGPVIYGDGAGGNLDGCAPFAAGSLSGQIVVVDRGVCAFSIKISNIGDAGGAIGIIALIAPGAPFAGAFGGGMPSIPGYMVSQADGDILRTGDAVATFDPDVGIPLVSSMVSGSSRGPQGFDNRVKPEIGAPGASVSAEVGTGDGETAFGGTSGASPMVAGSAALLLDAYPTRTPLELKAVLMNTAHTDIVNVAPTGLAPITRIGGGEVRVDRAFESPTAAWDWHEPTGALSFGFLDVEKKKQLELKWLTVRNYSERPVAYSLDPTFRFENDEMNGAVDLWTLPRVWVRPGRNVFVPVLMIIDGRKLRGNFMSSGSEGNDPEGLTLNEYDGYIILDDGEKPIHVPWHVLPRKAAEVDPRPQNLRFRSGVSKHKLKNRGVGDAQNDAYSLLAVSDNIPRGGPGEQEPTPDLRAVGVNTFPVPAGVCSAEASFIWAFVFNTWERQTHLVPVIHNVYLDIDRDGIDDYNVFNFDQSFSGAVSDGRQLTWSFDLSAGVATAFIYAEHAMNTANTVLYVCAEQVGLTGADILTTNVDVWFEAQDFYHGGPGDFIPPDPTVERITITPLGERYWGIPDDVPGNSTGALEVNDFGTFPGNSEELGILLLTNGDRGAGNRGGATKKTEAILMLAGGGHGHH